VSLGNIQVTSFAVCVVALGLGVLLLQFFTTETHGTPTNRTHQS
jgi:drug resistance transporter, bcr/cflA family